VNTLTDTETAALANRIRQRRWGWKAAFAAWHLVHGDTPCIDHRADGTRVVVWDTPEFIRTNLTNLPAVGLADIVQPDGTLSLDTEGAVRYRPLGELDSGFTAYERIT
jgi:hypothetical protein